MQDILEQLGNSGQLEPLLQADECQYGVTKSEEDSSWGRVKIKKNEDGSTEVLFLDFGSVEVKRLDEIFMMPEMVREIPAAAFWVSIASREEDTEENRMSIYDLLDTEDEVDVVLGSGNSGVFFKGQKQVLPEEEAIEEEYVRESVMERVVPEEKLTEGNPIMRKSVERRISFTDEVKMEPQKQVSTTTPSSTKSSLPLGSSGDGQPGAGEEDSGDGEPEQIGHSRLAKLSENNTVQQLKEQMDRELKGREEKKSRPIFAVEKHPVPVARQPKGPGSVGFVERREEKTVRRQMQSGKTVDVRRKVGPCSVISQKLLDAWVEGCKRMLENREYLGNLVKKEKRAVDWGNVDSEVLIARLEDGEEGQEEILNWILSGDNFQIICDSTSSQVSWVVSSLSDFVSSSGFVIGNEGCQQQSAGGSL